MCTLLILTIFSVDYLLPVRVGNEWVGVVYRDEECKMALMDHHDITNKAFLCDPSFNIESMKWFKNSCGKLNIIRGESRLDMVSIMGSNESSFSTKGEFLDSSPSTRCLTPTAPLSPTASLYPTTYLTPNMSFAAAMSLSPTPSPQQSPSPMHCVLQPVLVEIPSEDMSCDELVEWLGDLIQKSMYHKAFFDNFREQ